MHHPRSSRSRNRIGVWTWTLPFLLVATPGIAVAQQPPAPPTQAEAAAALQPPAPAQLTHAQIDQLVAPIALYPDQLLLEVLMAATFPQQVVDAGTWLQDQNNASLSGDALVAALQPLPWDPSVKSLVAFPQIVVMLNAHLDWTEALGAAFANQQVAVMARVQFLRDRAYNAKQLQTTSQLVVHRREGYIVIEPADPARIYVPVYNPAVVYGAWPDPGVPPVYVPPPPGFFHGELGAGILYSSAAVAVAAPLWGWGHPDWHRHEVVVDPGRYQNITNVTNVTQNHVTIRDDAWHRTAPVAFVPPGQRPPAGAARPEGEHAPHPPPGTVAPSAIAAPRPAPGPAGRPGIGPGRPGAPIPAQATPQTPPGAAPEIAPGHPAEEHPPGTPPHPAEAAHPPGRPGALPEHPAEVPHPPGAGPGPHPAEEAHPPGALPHPAEVPHPPGTAPGPRPAEEAHPPGALPHPAEAPHQPGTAPGPRPAEEAHPPEAPPHPAAEAPHPAGIAPRPHPAEEAHPPGAPPHPAEVPHPPPAPPHPAEAAHPPAPAPHPAEAPHPAAAPHPAEAPHPAGPPPAAAAPHPPEAAHPPGPAPAAHKPPPKPGEQEPK